MNTELATIIIITSLIVYVIIDFGFVRRQVKLASNLVLSLGILGTFIGISIALFFFNTKTDFQESIAYFINSLRLAFITSVIGITANLFIRIFIKIPKVDDSGDLYYYQLAFLEKIYRRIDDAHTMMLPTTAQVTAPTQDMSLLEELKKINENLLILTGVPSIVKSKIATSITGQAIQFQPINNWVEEHLSNSFEKLRRDLSVISTHLKDYPEALNNFQFSLRAITEEINNYNLQLFSLDEQITKNSAGVAFLRKQYTSEIQNRLGGIETLLERINKVLKLSSTSKTNDYV